MMVADPIVSLIMAIRKKNQKATIYEISDDFCDFPIDQKNHEFYASSANQNLIKQLAQQADLLQFSSHGLQRKYSHLNSNNVVFPNQINQDQIRVNKLDNITPILGWGGSIGHKQDAEQLARLLKLWFEQSNYDNKHAIKLALMCVPSIVTPFASTGITINHTHTASYPKYLDFLDGIDIGFAVIGDSDFSNGRSDGKYLEYASRQVLCLARNKGEYRHSIIHGMNGLLYGDDASFIHSLNLAVNNADHRQSMTANAIEYIKQFRTHPVAAKTRIECYQLICRTLTTIPGDYVNDSLSCESENILYQATLQHSQGDLNSALENYLKLVSLVPDFYLGWERCALLAKQLGSENDAMLFQNQAKNCLSQFLTNEYTPI